MATKKAERKAKVRKLSVDELVRIELAGANGQTRKIELKCQRVELDKLKKEQLLLIANHSLKTKEISELEAKIRVHESRNKLILADHKKFVDDLKERLKLKDNWGYNPETGEIKE